MELVGFGDLHIKPQNTALDYDALTLPPETDAIVMTGDVIHRVGPADLEEGQKFFRRLDDLGVPIICVPGNHDPLSDFEDLIEGVDSVVLCHERVVSGNEFDGFDLSESFEQHTFVGLGCESFDCDPEIRLIDFDALDPRTANDRRFAADAAASELEDTLYEYVHGEWSKSELHAELGIDSAERQRFDTQLQDAVEQYEHVSSLLADTDGPLVFLSHVPPYNTELDRHHSIGQRETDLQGLHVGSLGQKLALREHRPIAALSGHSHNGAYQVGIGTNVRPHLLNLDFRRAVHISVDGTKGVFSFEFK